MTIWPCLTCVLSIFFISCARLGGGVKQDATSRYTAMKSSSSKPIGVSVANESARIEEMPVVVSPPKQDQTPLGTIIEPYPFPYDRLPPLKMSGTVDMNLRVCKNHKLDEEQKKYCQKMGQFFVQGKFTSGNIENYFIWDRKEKCYFSSFGGVLHARGSLQARGPLQAPGGPLNTDIEGTINICFKDLKPDSLTIYIRNPLENNSGPPFGLPGQPPVSNFVMKAKSKEFSIHLDRVEMLIDVHFNGKIELENCSINHMHNLDQDPRGFKKDECYITKSLGGQISGNIKTNAIPLIND